MHSTVALLALAAGSAVAAPFDHVVRQSTTLNGAAKANGKLYFGTAVDNNDLSDNTYKSILAGGDFGQITPANSMKWDATEPSQGQFTYSQGDVIANLAATNGQKLRCHNTVWHNQLPSWVSNIKNNATLISVMKNHITNVVSHYKGKCYAWDVVNEAIDDNGQGTLRADPFSSTIGPAYLPIAFTAARAADPNAKLYYNDYNIEYPNAKSTGAVNLVKLIQSYGAPIDGVGLQSHFIAGQTPSTADQMTTMKTYTDLGVDVAITELDIRVQTPTNSARQAQQAKDYYSTIQACAKTARCVGVTVWDFTDKYSWVPGVFSGYGAALPWDSNEQKKADVYSSIIAGFSGGASATSTASSAPTSTGSSGSTTTAAPTTTSASTAKPTTTSSSSSGGSAQWGQCGGQGWTGPTTCQSPYTCHYSNPYYSQCY